MALRVAIAGLGERGRQWIAEIRDNPQFELVAAIDIDPAARDRTRRLAPGCGIHVSVAEALEARLDAALVVTPPDQHFEPAMAFLDAGIPTLIEKPLATSLADARSLVERASAAKVPLIVGQNYRYMRSHRTVRRLIHDGTLGDIRLASAHYYRVPHDMAPSLAGISNRILWGVGVHHLDALRWTLGREITRVFARIFSADPASVDRGDSLHVLLEFEGGARGAYTATYESSGHEFFEGGQEFYERIVGTEGTLHVFQRWLFLMPRGRLPRPVRRGKRAVTEEQILLRQFHDAIRTDVPADSSGEDNLKTMAVVEACLRSSVDGRWVDPMDLMHASN